MTDQRSTLSRRCAPVVSAFAWLLFASVASLNLSGAAHAADGEPCTGMPTVTDADGNVYPTVRIGDQCWMGKDLRNYKFNLGVGGIPPENVQNNVSQADWRSVAKPLRAESWFQEDENVKKGMVLYNWFAVMDRRGICPSGWRVPRIRDWDKLIGHLGGQNQAGGSLKSPRTTPPSTWGWRAPNETSDDAGFKGFPAGRRNADGAMDFEGVGAEAVWWSSEKERPTAFRARHDTKRLERISASPQSGFSVRCVFVPVRQPAVESCPVMGPLAIESIGSDRVSVRGEVVSNGNASVIARGVVYGTSPEPVVGVASSVPAGSGTGPFTSQIAGLTPSTTYYARAYGTNRRGTCYGPPLVITTSAPPLSCPAVTTEQVEQVGTDQARVRGRIVSDGGAAVTNQGIVWGMSPNPTLADSSTSAPVQDGVFRGNLLGLSSATTYHARAFATNSVGTCYGASVPLTTLSAPPVCPVVTTMAVEAVGPDWVKVKGRVDSDGGAAVTARGVVWGPSPAPVVGPGSNSTSAGPGTGEFTTQYQGTGLSPNTSYFVRAYATNSAGTCYGATLAFSTLPLPASCPTVVTNEVVETQLGRARVRGTVTSANGAEVTARGVVYGTSADPTIGSGAVQREAQGLGSFDSDLTGLLPATTYHARAYATNSGGTCYGVSKQFTTPSPQACAANPTVTDVSGNVYDTVQIGLQCWMKQNLRTAKYRNDEPVTRYLAGTQDYANAPNDVAGWVDVNAQNWNEQAFGKIYTHGAVVDTRGLCPVGWRTPTEADWNTLVTFLDPDANVTNPPTDEANFQMLSSTAGGALKSTALFPAPLFGWPSPNTAATDSSGFVGLPAGWAAHGGVYVGGGAMWWTANTNTNIPTRAWYRTAQRDSGAFQRRSDLRKFGLSVRCVKD